MSQPQVSVLLPVFNGERYVEESIRSILGQQGVSFELLVIDDASTDGTPAVLRRLADSDERIRLIELRSNRGASEALNAGLESAAGTYIARQDADDVSLPGRLAAQAAFLDREPEVVLLGTNYVHIDAAGGIIAEADHARSSPVLAFLLNFTNSLGVPGQGMFRADAARAAGGFSREFRFAQGYELWTRLAMRGRVAVLPIVGLQYRVHEQSATATHGGEQQEVAAEVSRRMLSFTLGREVRRDEGSAVFRIWRGMPRPGDIRIADAVIAEAFAVFLRGNPSDADRAAAREAVARRFARAAGSRARAGNVKDGFHAINLAFRWHPDGFGGIASVAAKRIAKSVRGRNR